MKPSFEKVYCCLSSEPSIGLVDGIECLVPCVGSSRAVSSSEAIVHEIAVQLCSISTELDYSPYHWTGFFRVQRQAGEVQQVTYAYA